MSRNRNRYAEEKNLHHRIMDVFHHPAMMMVHHVAAAMVIAMSEAVAQKEAAAAVLNVVTGMTEEAAAAVLNVVTETKEEAAVAALNVVTEMTEEAAAAVLNVVIEMTEEAAAAVLNAVKKRNINLIRSPNMIVNSAYSNNSKKDAPHHSKNKKKAERNFRLFLMSKFQ